MKRIEGSAGTVSPPMSPAPARRSPASRLARRHQCAVGHQQDEQVAEGDRGAARGRADAGTSHGAGCGPSQDASINARTSTSGAESSSGVRLRAGRRGVARAASAIQWWLVFVKRNGEPQVWSSLTAALRMALDRAGLPQIRVQDLRDTAATVLLDAGAHPKA